MITDRVIKEIYKKYSKPPKSRDALQLPYYLDLLGKTHNIEADEDEIIIKDLEEFNPFRRFLIRSLTGILEFDKMVAFVFKNHILFFGIEGNELRVHIKPEEPKSIFSRIFGK